MAKRSSRSKGKAGKSSVVHGKKQNGLLAPGVLLPALLIAGLTWWAYWPALNGDWLGDDTMYVTANKLMMDPDRIWKAWFEPGSFIEYYPLEQTFQWLQWQIFGMETWGYHVTNVALHLLSAFLVWRLLHKLGLKFAWLGGLIFAIHPMQVESVAFINELKNTLSLPPFLLALCRWIDFERRRDRRDYFWALGWFFVAMLCKINMTPFPFFILLYAWYLRGRIGWADVKFAAPFFVISLVLGVTLIWSGEVFAHSSHSLPIQIPLGGILSRFALAGLTILFYFSRCFLPIEPMPMYPHWPVDPASPRQFLPWLALGGIFIWLWANRRTWGRHALLGWGFFLLFLAPFLGFNKTTYMATVWVMDHMLYVPIIGFIGLTVAALGAMSDRLARGIQRNFAIIPVVVAVVLMVWQTHSYAAKFIDAETWYRYAIEVNPQAWLARYNLSVELVDEGKFSEAREQLEAAAALYPGYSRIHSYLGTADEQLGRTDEAQKEFEEALRIDPDDAETYAEWGQADWQVGQASDAVTHAREALRLDPGNALGHKTLGIALCQQGETDLGLHEFDEAERLNPFDATAYLNSGVALANVGRMSEAKVQFETAVRMDPSNEVAQSYLARLRTEPAPVDSR